MTASEPQESDHSGTADRIPAAMLIEIGFIGMLVIIWETLARVSFAELNLVFPSIIEILGATTTIIVSGSIVPHFLTTVQEVIVAFVLAAVVGISLGVALGSNEFVAQGIEPVIYYISSVPKLLLYPIMLLALGIGFESKVAMGFFSALFPITVNTITGTLSVRESLVKVAHSNGASPFQTFQKVYVPSIATHILNGLRIGAGVAVIGVIIAEHYAARSGLGNRVLYYFSNFEMARMYAVLVVIFVLSFAANRGLLKVQEYLSHRGYGTGEGRGGDEGHGF